MQVEEVVACLAVEVKDNAKKGLWEVENVARNKKVLVFHILIWFLKIICLMVKKCMSK